MNTSFTARHFEASKRLHNYSVEAVQKLTKFYDGILDCDIIVQPTQDHDEPQSAELTVKVKGDLLQASEKAATYEQALGKAIDNMTRQLRKYKDKRSK
ncbi:SSU ribosomal protein S30P /sigma 54 modulation protein [Cyclonatronum proteinivorum]|uniref:SSU ribosomal protein S30P /sigma 54 modulation protein n=1 Tax=Cyclonatronum proteinivorum TaxID=1457365 RepID=A0A345UL44_9BACT|nr:ribosome-associated translation inhibitor RaiA [Cyclonatronum proteinivorum]AXJ01196.1 SSU ribosomal protein S30P /sigma 54 modulation protein [Cyclonatronum proteinivorum]